MKYEVFWKNPGYKSRPELKEDIECDYLIVGGGVAGVSLAYFLSKKTNKKIVLIEKNTIASGATGKAAGSLVLEGELDLLQIIKKYGKKKGLEFWKINKSTLEDIKNLVKKEKIKCDFSQENTIYGSMNKKGDAIVLDEYIAQKDIESETKLLVGKELIDKINTPLFKYIMLSPKHGISVNPLMFTQNLSNVVNKNGVKIYENTTLTKLYENHNMAETPKGNIKFKEVILAIDSDVRNSKVKKISSTIIVTEPLKKSELKHLSLLPKKIIWDSKDIYHYMKITKDNRILLGYGDKHISKKRTSIDPHQPHLKRIESFLHKLFPHLHKKIEYAWSGHFGTTEEKLPIMERKGTQITFAGAASQVSCVMAAQYISDKLTGRKSKLEPFFNIE
ncbi:MAG: FAD-dependent oxidoreductase [Nanoarchaeota archaeon]